jgi:hypothetical protein
MHIPDKQLSTAPATIPLWYFDEDKGVWQEEGSATKQGNKYIGTVSHFTDWNCDEPEETALVIGRLIDCHGDPGWGHLEFGQVGSDESGGSQETKQSDGSFAKRVPANTPITIVIYDPLFISPLVPTDQGKGKVIIIVPPLKPKQVYDVGKVQVFPCLSKVRGSLKVKSDDKFDYMVFESESGGMRVENEIGSDFLLGSFAPNTKHTLTIFTTSGRKITKEFTTPEGDKEINLGILDLSTLPDPNLRKDVDIVGKLVCNAAALTQGQVSATFKDATGNNKIEYASPGSDGSFKITVGLNTMVELSMTTTKGTLKHTVTTTSSPVEINAGVFDFCVENQPTENSFVITGDGYNKSKNVFNLKPYPNSGAMYVSYEGVTQAFIEDIPDTLHMGIVFTGKTTGVMPKNDKTGLIIQKKVGSKTNSYSAGFAIDGTNLTLTVTRYDAVGKLIEGTFSGTFLSTSGSFVTITDGKFSALRIQDL